MRNSQPFFLAFRDDDYAAKNNDVQIEEEETHLELAYETVHKSNHTDN